MQVEDLDDHVCMMRGCSEVDLLPAKCGACKKKFCHTHLSYQAHNCAARPDAVVLTCPICNQVVPHGPHDDPNVVVSQHIDRQCKDTPKGHQLPTAPRDEKGRERFNFCSFPTCNKNELTLIVCDKCGNSYCVDHRTAVKHNCIHTQPKRSSPPPTLTESQRKAVPASTAFDRRFRNTPDTPLGTYRGDQSLTVPVVIASFQNDGDVRRIVLLQDPFFFKFGSQTVVGRVIDQICEAVDFRNANNANGDKLRLFQVPKQASSGLRPAPMNSRMIDLGIRSGDPIALCLLPEGDVELPHRAISEFFGRSQSSSIATASSTCSQM